jgi:hemolysin activation/secretion protein
LLAWIVVLSTAMAPCAAQSAAPTSAPSEAGGAAQAFDLLELQVEGNTVLPVEAIEVALEPHLGPGKGMAGVEAARAALEAVYQKAGYLTVLVDVPEQRVDGGVVRLAVLEGRVGGLYVLGSRYHDQGYIRTACRRSSARSTAAKTGACSRCSSRAVCRARSMSNCRSRTSCRWAARSSSTTSMPPAPSHGA